MNPTSFTEMFKEFHRFTFLPDQDRISWLDKYARIICEGSFNSSFWAPSLLLAILSQHHIPGTMDVLSLVTTLIENGADIHAVDSMGNSALRCIMVDSWYREEHGGLDATIALIRLFLEHGANTAILDNRGVSLLKTAIDFNPDFLSYLHADDVLGIPCYSTDFNTIETPLSWALRIRDVQSVFFIDSAYVCGCVCLLFVNVC